MSTNTESPNNKGCNIAGAQRRLWTAPVVEQARGSGGDRAIAAYVWGGPAARGGGSTETDPTSDQNGPIREGCSVLLD